MTTSAFSIQLHSVTCANRCLSMPGEAVKSKLARLFITRRAHDLHAPYGICASILALNMKPHGFLRDTLSARSPGEIHQFIPKGVYPFG